MHLQAGVNVYFQARYGQAASEGSAEAAEFRKLSQICCSVLNAAPHHGGALLHSCLRCMLDMIHMDPTHFLACHEGGMPDAFLAMLRNGAPPYWPRADPLSFSLFISLSLSLSLTESVRTLSTVHTLSTTPTPRTFTSSAHTLFFVHSLSSMHTLSSPCSCLCVHEAAFFCRSRVANSSCTMSPVISVHSIW
jgi:Domain of Unknown Function (DUF913)